MSRNKELQGLFVRCKRVVMDDILRALNMLIDQPWSLITTSKATHKWIEKVQDIIDIVQNEEKVALDIWNDWVKSRRRELIIMTDVDEAKHESMDNIKDITALGPVIAEKLTRRLLLGTYMYSAQTKKEAVKKFNKQYPPKKHHEVYSILRDHGVGV